MAGTSSTSTNPAASSAFANPLMNPYMNPLINPYATQQVNSPVNAGLYLFAAQSMYGGIGSGRISGTRPAPGGESKGGSKSESGSSTHRSSANTPGGTASRYFSRASAPQAPQNGYYHRQSRYFPQGGK
jgi:hypothetical protein